jgi:hypothetical protein
VEAQHRYRAKEKGKEKRKAQSWRYRERLRNRKEQACVAAEAAARVIPLDFFRWFLRPAWLLPAVRAHPEIAAATVLFAGVPARCGARLRAGTAMAKAADRVTTAGNTAQHARGGWRWWPV